MTRMTQIFAAAALVAAAASAAPAFAQSPNIQVQTGLICDTAEQAMRVGELARKGDFGSALTTVNLEAAKPSACGVASVAFIADEEVAEVSADNGVKLHRIIRITVVGIKGPGGMQPVKPLTQFALAPSKSVEA